MKNTARTYVRLGRELILSMYISDWMLEFFLCTEFQYHLTWKTCKISRNFSDEDERHTREQTDIMQFQDATSLYFSVSSHRCKENGRQHRQRYTLSNLTVLACKPNVLHDDRIFCPAHAIPHHYLNIPRPKGVAYGRLLYHHCSEVLTKHPSIAKC
jgi:hypothetical protein